VGSWRLAAGSRQKQATGRTQQAAESDKEHQPGTSSKAVPAANGLLLQSLL